MKRNKKKGIWASVRDAGCARCLAGLFSLGMALSAVSVSIMPALVVSAEEFTVTDAGGTAVIQTDALNVRSGPGKEYEAIGKARAGEEYTVSGETENGWYRIDYNGGEGYVSGEYVTVALSGQEKEADAENGEEKEVAPIPGLPGVWQKIKAGGMLSVAAAILIPVLILAIVFTVRSMMRAGDEEEDEDYPDDEEFEEDEYDPEDGEFEEDGYDPEDEEFEEDGYDPEAVEPAAEKEEDLREERAREAFLRREVAPYIEEETALRRAAEELEAKKAAGKDEETDEELRQAMEKLSELQQEIERIKQKKEKESDK